MINPGQFRQFVIDPTLKHIGLYSEAASNLLLGTALVESRLTFLKQSGAGPALGVFQIEPATFDDVYLRYLRSHPIIEARVRQLVMDAWDPLEQLAMNHALGCAVARCRYLYAPPALPGADDTQALAAYWVKHYNAGGAGTVEKYVSAWDKAGVA